MEITQRETTPSTSAYHDERQSAVSWQDIKSRFVDDPAGAVAAAQDLVRRAVEDKIRRLKEEEAGLDRLSGKEDPSSTEGLRAKLIRYQSFVEGL